MNRGGPIYWLTRRSRRFWIVAPALLPVFYVASFGPWCWIACWLNSDTSKFCQVYPPVVFIPMTPVIVDPHDELFQDGDIQLRTPLWLSQALYRYSLFGTDGSWTWLREGGDGMSYSFLGKNFTIGGF
jgi:hypothetical protein